jgi:hypothetical protein
MIKIASILILTFVMACSPNTKSRYKNPQTYRHKSGGPQTKEACKKLYPRAPEWWKNAKCSFYDDRRISSPARRNIQK